MVLGFPVLRFAVLEVGVLPSCSFGGWVCMAVKFCMPKRLSFVVLGFWCVQLCEFAVLGVGVLPICSFDVWDLQFWSFGVRFPVLEVAVLGVSQYQGCYFASSLLCESALSVNSITPPSILHLKESARANTQSTRFYTNQIHTIF